MAETRWLTGAGYFACVLLGIEKGPRHSFHALTFFFFVASLCSRHPCLLNNVRRDRWNKQSHRSCLNKEEDMEGQRSKTGGENLNV